MLAFSYFCFLPPRRARRGPFCPEKKKLEQLLFSEYGAVLVSKAAPPGGYGAEKWFFADNLTNAALKKVKRTAQHARRHQGALAQSKCAFLLFFFLVRLPPCPMLFVAALFGPRAPPGRGRFLIFCAGPANTLSFNRFQIRGTDGRSSRFYIMP